MTSEKARAVPFVNDILRIGKSCRVARSLGLEDASQASGRRRKTRESIQLKLKLTKAAKEDEVEE